MNKILTVFVGAFLTIVLVGALLGCFSGWLLLLGFGIWHLHVASSVPAIGWQTAWPLGLIFGLLTAKGSNTSKK